MNIVAIIQARMSSTRLPGKVLADINGRPLLSYMVERVRRAKELNKVVIATTLDPSDDPIVRFCDAFRISCTRGSMHDVLDRYYRAAKQSDADVVVRLTADCPLMDPTMIDDVVRFFRSKKFEFVSNTVPPETATIPDGMDVEVFSIYSLERAWREAKKPSDREHVTFYMWQNPDLFSVYRLDLEKNWSKYRLTVDYPEDLEVVRAVIRELYPSKPDFSLSDIIQLLSSRVDLFDMNSGIKKNQGWQTAFNKDVEAGFRSDSRSASPRSFDMQRRARHRIPGVTQLLSKRPEMFAPGVWPGYYSRAKGVETWDLDGNKYIDMSISGIGANVLGFADPDVDGAVLDAIANGSKCSLNAPEEVELAELLCEIHPWAQMVRYARTGGEAMAVAIRIARSYSGKDKIAFCGYHGWHDWYLAANLGAGDSLNTHLLPGLEPSGVPRSLTGTSIPFEYNRVDQLETILSRNKGSVGVIVMEPLRSHDPAPGFLEKIRELADHHQAVLVFDEITAAFRLNSAGAHLRYGVNPDVAVFAKAMSNGYPMAAVVGTEPVMQAAQNTFISSTYWTERIGPVAALATIRKHRKLDVATHLVRIGQRVQDGWQEAARKCDLKVHVDGIPPLSHFSFEVPNAQAMMTLFVQMMLDRGYLASGRFYSTFAHQDEHVDGYLRSVGETFAKIARLNETSEVESSLRGAVAHSGFKRLA